MSNKLLLKLKRQDFPQFCCFWKTAKYCRDLEPEPEPKLFESRNRTETNRFGFTTLAVAPVCVHRSPRHVLKFSSGSKHMSCLSVT
jgi:hypothetical protein